MKIGVPKEIKPQEHRIGLTPESVKTLISEGHEVLTLSGVNPIRCSYGLISLGTPIFITLSPF